MITNNILSNLQQFIIYSGNNKHVSTIQAGNLTLALTLLTLSLLTRMLLTLIRGANVSSKLGGQYQSWQLRCLRPGPLLYGDIVLEICMPNCPFLHTHMTIFFKNWLPKYKLIASDVIIMTSVSLIRFSLDKYFTVNGRSPMYIETPT